MSDQKLTGKFPTAERVAFSSRQKDPPHPNKLPREGRPFLLPSPPKPRKPKPLTEFAAVRRRGSTNSLADNATQKRQAKMSAQATTFFTTASGGRWSL